MDFALETGTAGHASHKIDLTKVRGLYGPRFGVFEKRRFLWVIPYWHRLDWFQTKDAAEEWLKANWKLPAYFHVTRKTPA